MGWLSSEVGDRYRFGRRIAAEDILADEGRFPIVADVRISGKQPRGCDGILAVRVGLKLA
jgi:hypothetical protein